MNIDEIIFKLEKTIGKESNVDAVYRNISNLDEEEQIEALNFYLREFIDILKKSNLNTPEENKTNIAISILFYLATLEKDSIEEEIELLINSISKNDNTRNIDDYINLLSDNIKNNFSIVNNFFIDNKNLTNIIVKRLYKIEYCIASIIQSFIDNKMNYLKTLK